MLQKIRQVTVRPRMVVSAVGRTGYLGDGIHCNFRDSSKISSLFVPMGSLQVNECIGRVWESSRALGLKERGGGSTEGTREDQLYIYDTNPSYEDQLYITVQDASILIICYFFYFFDSNIFLVFPHVLNGYSFVSCWWSSHRRLWHLGRS